MELIEAAKTNDFELAISLIKKGVDMNYEDRKDSMGLTALMHASLQGYYDMCEFLIEKGADVNYSSKYGSTALTIASFRGYKELCKMLIEKGADVNARNDYDATPLINATHNARIEICELLIENGADIDAIDEDGQTALTIATNERYRQIMKLLIINGANLTIKFNSYYENRSDIGYNVLKTAIRNRYYDIINLLVEKKYNFNQGILDAILNRDKQVCEFLIDSGVYVKPYGKIHLMLYDAGWEEVYEKVVWNRRKHLLAIYYE